MLNVLEEQESFFKYINNSITVNKKISHAYLIETNGYQNHGEVLKELVKIILTINIDDQIKKKIIYQVDNDIYQDLKIINPDGNYIKKEQLVMLENQYSKTSMLNNKLIYIIDPADKLNLSSANTILKFLEEPPKDIIAILVTENKYNVLETIVSRCQCLSLVNNNKFEYSDIIIEFSNDLFDFKKILIKYDYYLENLFSDRNNCIDNLKLLEEYLFFKLKSDINKDELCEQERIISYIELIEKEKEKLQYNINIKLWFSNFIFSIMEVR